MRLTGHPEPLAQSSSDLEPGDLATLGERLHALLLPEFIDAGARRGTTAFYRVTALATDGTETLPAGDYVITAPVQ
ncbi:hypothetical protein ACWD4O_46930 [Streptomyces sp. NPDC002623]